MRFVMYSIRKPCEVVGVTVSGVGAEFIQKAVANGMLGSAVASKIQGVFCGSYAEWSDVHSRKLQLLNLPALLAFGNLDIISGNPSYLAVTCSGCGVCDSMEHRKTGPSEMTSGKGFRIPRNAELDGGYMFKRESTAA